MRLAIIGCGNIARQHVIPMQNAGFKIVGIAGKVSEWDKPEGYRFKDKKMGFLWNN